MGRGRRRRRNGTQPTLGQKGWGRRRRDLRRRGSGRSVAAVRRGAVEAGAAPVGDAAGRGGCALGGASPAEADDGGSGKWRKRPIAGRGKAEAGGWVGQARVDGAGNAEEYGAAGGGPGGGVGGWTGGASQGLRCWRAPAAAGAGGRPGPGCGPSTSSARWGREGGCLFFMFV